MTMTTEGRTPPGPFSDFIVYVDESGDHGMQTLDRHYPVFVLAFCVFHKPHYSERVVPALQTFKFNHFGHDLTILHEHEIRKETGDFHFFRNRQHKNDFLGELTDLIEASDFVLISCVIDKAALKRKEAVPPNPYHVALAVCLERLHEFLREQQQDSALTHVVVEQRGQKEDDELELEFRRICDGANRLGLRLPFDVKFASKKVNSAGLQLADLVARPIGLSVLRPDQPNRAFDILQRKFFCGLKVYPVPESEKPR
jgi:hypothetical protein